jgi:hypothetical protein
MTKKKKHVKLAKTSQTRVVAIAILVGILVAGSSMYLAHTQTSQAPATPTMTPTPIVSPVSAQERQQIDLWIKKNDLNEYGDPKDTMYPGGTPLFNEATGQTMDKYVYIFHHHSDKPWQK